MYYLHIHTSILKLFCFVCVWWSNLIEIEAQNKMKYILVTGGVISGIGKGVIASSLGTLFKAHGLRVTPIKIDPYINIDAGTFSPYEHGEWSTIPEMINYQYQICSDLFLWTYLLTLFKSSNGCQQCRHSICCLIGLADCVVLENHKPICFGICINAFFK